SGVRSQRAPNPWMASRSALNVASGALNSNAPDATPKRPAPVVTGVAAVRRDLVVVVREGLRVGDGAARVVVLVRCVGRIGVDAGGGGSRRGRRTPMLARAGAGGGVEGRAPQPRCGPPPRPPAAPGWRPG